MSRSRRLSPPARYIYVIGPSEGLQKVGIATDPRIRMASLQTASPFDLFLHATVAVPFAEAHSVERRAHQALARYRVRNEWFDTTPADATAAIHAAAAPFQKASKPKTPSTVFEHTTTMWRVTPAGQGTPSTVGGAPMPLFEFKPVRPASNVTLAPETQIDTLNGYRLEMQCCTGLTSYPLHLLAASLPQGGRTPLGAAIGLFRCERCRAAPKEVTLVEHPATGARSPNAWRVEVGAMYDQGQR